MQSIQADHVTVGRASDCAVCINSTNISRRHLSLSYKNQKVLIEDHGSSNGTYVNGVQLKPHAPRAISEKDQIRLGRSEVYLHVNVEGLEQTESIVLSPPESRSVPPRLSSRPPKVTEKVKPPTGVPEAPPLPAEDQEISRSGVVIRSSQTSSRVTLSEVNANAGAPASENVLQEARKKAAQVIQDAEIQAEKKVQEVYQRAHETNAKAEEFYRNRLQEAYREAEKIYSTSEKEGHEALHAAREQAQKIREQAEQFVYDLRQQTELECERLISEATESAIDLKENRLKEAEEMIQKKEEEVITSVRGEMEERLKQFQERMETEDKERRQALETETEEHRLRLSSEREEHEKRLEHLKADAESLSTHQDQERKKLADIQAENQKVQTDVEALRAESSALKEELTRCRTELAALEETARTERERRDTLQTEVAELTEKAANFKSQVTALETALQAEEQRCESETLLLKNRFAEERARIEKEEERHLEEMKLETSRRVQALEREMLGELIERRDRMGREIVLAFEAYMKAIPADQDWSKTSKGLETKVQEIVAGQIETLARDGVGQAQKTRILKAQSKRRWKNWMPAMAAGALAFWLGQTAYKQAGLNPAPMDRMIASQAEQARLDLLKRRFNPPQTPELRDNYVDSVIYTSDFTKIYVSDSFQKVWYDAISAYLLKTWHLDENKSAEVVSTARALVEDLAARKEKIHPDYVKEGIKKMRDAEKAALQKMKKTLGSNVRLESYKRFEKTFYEKYQAKKSALESSPGSD